MLSKCKSIVKSFGYGVIKIKEATKQERFYANHPGYAKGINCGFLGVADATKESFEWSGASLKLEESKACKEEFKAIIDKFNQGIMFDNPLENIKNANNFFKGFIKNEKNNPVLRLDTFKHVYIFYYRDLPWEKEDGRIEIIAHCYQKNLFDNHLKKAKEGLHFIEYKDTEQAYMVIQDSITINDGECLGIVKNEDGKLNSSHLCHYVNDNCFEIDNVVLKYNEFALMLYDSKHTLIKADK